MITCSKPFRIYSSVVYSIFVFSPHSVPPMKNLFLLVTMSLLSVRAGAQQPDIKPAPEVLSMARISDRISQGNPAYANANIYEVNIRQYTPSGTINAFSQHLERLAGMGVKILWLMPIQPIGVEKRKGSLGSYYSISDYLAINPEMGTMEDFIQLVKKAHSLNMRVILDWVANHTAFDHAWIKAHPDYYKHDEKGNIIPPVEDWTDVAALNYDNVQLRRAMADCMLFWVKATDIDGFRCDVADMVPLDFWQSVRRELDQVKPVFMLAEAEKPEMHDHAFDMTYSWNQHHRMNEIVKGKKTAKTIDEYLEGQKAWPANAYRMYFTSNHDENSWNGTEYERMGEGAQAFAVLTFGLNGMPLIYSGQEAALNRRLKFFERDPIDWNNYPLADFYTRLIKLKTQAPALQHGAQGGTFTKLATGKDDAMYAFVRSKDESKVVFILNLSAKAQKINISAPELAGKASDIFSGQSLVLKNKQSFSLKPWQYIVYHYTN